MGMMRRFRNLGRREQMDADIAAEMHAHIDLAVEDAMRAGMSESEARRQARLRFGNPVVVQERTAGADATLGLNSIGRDLKFALRQMRRSPGFAVTAIMTFALGIGANIVVFGVLNAVLLHPLHVKDPQQLVEIYHKEWMSGGPSYPAFEDYRRRNTAFSEMAAVYGLSGEGLGWQNSVTRVSGDDVTGNYFHMLGVQPELGRFFDESDEHGPGSAPLVVISDALWRNLFHADPGVIGRTIELSKHPFTIVGVAPRTFQGTERFLWPDYWVPMVNEEQVEGWDFLHSRVYEPVTVTGRLKPGVSIRQATDNLNAIAGQLQKEYPETDRDQSARLIRPGLEGDNGEIIRKFLLGVTLLAALVLLAACANLASLFAARAADRSRELALRVSLGASRNRLLRQLLTEAVLLSLLGGAAGMAFAAALLSLLDHWTPSFGSGAMRLAIDVDARVDLVGLGLSLASGLLFGIIPARHAWQSSPLQAMKSAPAELAHLRRFALRDLLLGAQIAICTLLVTSSLVAVRGMVRALNAPLGIQPQGAMLAELDLGMMGVGGDEALVKEKQIIQAAQNIPGVTAAGTINFATTNGEGMRGIPVYRPGTVDFTLNNYSASTRLYPVSPGYLQAAGTRLLGGRDVRWTDTKKAPWVAVVSQTFARQMWGNTPAVGQRFIVFTNLTEVVGVTEDGKYGDLTNPPEPAAYLPLPQYASSTQVLVVRSQRPASEMAAALQKTLSAIEPGMPMVIHTWEDALSNMLFPARVATIALGTMGLLAAMLAVTGIFGMAAYSVSKRMKELGIRVALGAKRVQILAAAIGRLAFLLAAGSLLGLLLGVFANRLLGRIVYEGDPRDPLVLGGAIATMTLLGLLASWIPARRALQVNLSRLMRED
jgi:predicted permease